VLELWQGLDQHDHRTAANRCHGNLQEIETGLGCEAQ
jgi:hypothetical protein